MELEPATARVRISSDCTGAGFDASTETGHASGWPVTAAVGGDDGGGGGETEDLNSACGEGGEESNASNAAAPAAAPAAAAAAAPAPAPAPAPATAPSQPLPQPHPKDLFLQPEGEQHLIMHKPALCLTSTCDGMAPATRPEILRRQRSLGVVGATRTTVVDVLQANGIDPSTVSAVGRLDYETSGYVRVNKTLPHRHFC